MMIRFLILIISSFFVFTETNGQELDQFEEIVRNEDSLKLDQFVKSWERESFEKLENPKKENEEYYLLYKFFVSLANSGKIYPYKKDNKNTKWRIIQDSLRIKKYEKIYIDTVSLPEEREATLNNRLILTSSEKLQEEFSVELTPNLEKGENLLLLETKRGRTLEKFLNGYLVRFFDVNIKKEEKSVQKYEFAKRIEEVIGKKIGFDFFMDGILEWNLVDFPIVEEIEFDESMKKAIIKYHYLLEGGFALVLKNEMEAKWELAYSANMWIR